MPAIQLARLKIQTEELAAKANDPPAFRRGLHALLDLYADRTYRPGLVGEPQPLLMAYHVPRPVLRQILSALLSHLTRDPEIALALSDVLWSDPTYEFHLLAIFILGEFPIDLPEQILERFAAWARPTTEKRLIQALIENGLARFRQEHGGAYLAEAADRLAGKTVFLQQLGLQCLEPVINAQDFEDYPAITRLLAPILRDGSPALRPDLLRLIQALGKKSSKETAFFLRQNLMHQDDNLNTAWLIRHSLPDFPVETQSYLREGLREWRMGN
jgi:hypothetical protein